MLTKINTVTSVIISLEFERFRRKYDFL